LLSQALCFFQIYLFRVQKTSDKNYFKEHAYIKLLTWVLLLEFIPS
jgi:hypothetical protein